MVRAVPVIVVYDKGPMSRARIIRASGLHYRGLQTAAATPVVVAGGAGGGNSSGGGGANGGGGGGGLELSGHYIKAGAKVWGLALGMFLQDSRGFHAKTVGSNLMVKRISFYFTHAPICFLGNIQDVHMGGPMSRSALAGPIL